MPSHDDLPSALPAMWRVLKRGYAAEPRLLLVSFGLSLLAALPDAMLALWFKLLADGVIGRDRRLAFIAAAGLGVSAPATWFLRVMSGRVQRYFRERLTIALEAHVARLQATVAGIEHHERPAYLDRLAMLRDQVFVLDHIYMSIFSTCGWFLRLGVTLALLMSIHPALGLLAVFAVPTVLTATWRPGVERAAMERAAAPNRLARHLYVTATTAPPGKEVRVTGIGERLAAWRLSAWEAGYRPVASARATSALWHTGAWAIFGVGFVAAVAFAARVVHAGPGAVLLVLAAGSRLSAYIGATVGEIGFLRGIWIDGSRRLAWLEDYAAAQDEHADAAVPDRLEDGIRLDHVSFAYPGTDRLVLEDVSLRLEPGSVVAIVGENGAGKTTLVKLLCRMYRPTKGRILVDGADLSRMPASGWRSRLAGAFQDFYRFEFRRGRRSASAMCRGSTTPRRWPRPWTAPGPGMSSPASPPASRRSSGRPGPRGWRSASASGRSWPWPAASCAIGRCSWCSTSRPPRSTPRPSTRCSSGTPPRPAATAPPARPTAGSRSWSRTGSARSGWPTRSSCSTGPAWSRWARTRS